MKRHVYAFLIGGFFAFSLGISGMMQPSKNRGFSDFFGEWDPPLLFVLGPAVGIYLLGTLFVRRMPPKRFEANAPPDRINARFVLGSIRFGIGWSVVACVPDRPRWLSVREAGRAF